MVFIDDLKIAFKNKKNIILIASCSISYSGRTETFLDVGERIIFVKPDGTLLVHQNKGNTPINYMKEGTEHSLNLEPLGIRSYNKSSKEYMDISLLEIKNLVVSSLTDNEKLQLAGSEKDMSDMIFSSPRLIEQGFKPLSREEHTKFGFIDVFGYDKDGVFVVVECKRNTANFQAVEQLERYVNKIKESKGLNNVRGIIAAPSITPKALDMLKGKNFSFCVVNPPKKLERSQVNQKVLVDYFN